MKLNDRIKEMIDRSFCVHPNFPPLLAAAIPAIIALVGSGVSAGVQANSANKQIGATNAANMANMALNKQELGISQENADTNKYQAHEEVRIADTANFLQKIKGTQTGRTMVDIWAGK